MTTKCQSLWGHRFEGRYSYAAPPAFSSIKPGGVSGSGMSIEYAESLARAWQDKTYHGDICVRCGVVVPPLPSPDGGKG